MSNSWAGGPGTAQSVQSVDRAVAILEILARDGEAGVTEVARELDVHKSTASRLLAALDRRELVTQDAARGKFRLGIGIVRLAGAASARLDVVRRGGFVTAVDELEAGVSAIAAPVRDAEVTVLASVSASGPSFRIPAVRIPALAAAVRRAADEVSRRLGWAAR